MLIRVSSAVVDCERAGTVSAMAAVAPTPESAILLTMPRRLLATWSPRSRALVVAPLTSRPEFGNGSRPLRVAALCEPPRPFWPSLFTWDSRPLVRSVSQLPRNLRALDFRSWQQEDRGL